MDFPLLTGRTIAVPESRELDVFSAMLERRGANVLRCPLVTIADAPDHEPVLRWIREFNRGGCDDLILLTGEGLRRLLACIDRHEQSLHAGLVSALARVRKITRGPKPARALRELALKPDLVAESPTSDGVMACLSKQNLSGRRIGLQLYGTEPNRPLVEFLQRAGAAVLPVAPYAYVDAAADRVVRALLDQVRAGRVDAIAFTSSAQVERLFAVEPADDVRAALARTAVAAVGPLVAATLARHGIGVCVVPRDSFFLKPLTALLVQELGPKADAGRA